MTGTLAHDDGTDMKVDDLPTPALVVELGAVHHNITTMSEALPGPRLRPHVKAHKCTELAKLQAAAGHHRFTCATIREVEGMVAAGLGEDLLLANEVLDTRRLGALVEGGARVTLAVDSPVTVEAAASGSIAAAYAPVGALLEARSARSEINANYISKIDGSGAPVTCGTCHRGHFGPEPFAVPPPPEPHGN